MLQVLVPRDRGVLLLVEAVIRESILFLLCKLLFVNEIIPSTCACIYKLGVSLQA